MSKDEFKEEMSTLPDDSLIRILRWFHEELARRIKALDEAGALFTKEEPKKKEKKLKRVVVRFPGYHKRYAYMAPADAEPGDVVMTPGHWGGYGDRWVDPSLAFIVDEQSTYSGATKEVVALYKKEK